MQHTSACVSDVHFDPRSRNVLLTPVTGCKSKTAIQLHSLQIGKPGGQIDEVSAGEVDIVLFTFKISNSRFVE